MRGLNRQSKDLIPAGFMERKDTRLNHSATGSADDLISYSSYTDNTTFPKPIPIPIPRTSPKPIPIPIPILGCCQSSIPIPIPIPEESDLQYQYQYQYWPKHQYLNTNTRYCPSLIPNIITITTTVHKHTNRLYSIFFCFIRCYFLFRGHFLRMFSAA